MVTNLVLLLQPANHAVHRRLKVRQRHKLLWGSSGVFNLGLGLTPQNEQPLPPASLAASQNPTFGILALELDVGQGNPKHTASREQAPQGEPPPLLLRVCRCCCPCCTLKQHT